MDFKLTEEQRKRQYNRRKPQQAAEVVNEFGKLQPQNLELEDAVLGALMLEKDAYSKVVDILKPECFYEPNNQKIFEAIQTLGSLTIYTYVVKSYLMISLKQWRNRHDNQKS